MGPEVIYDPTRPCLATSWNDKTWPYITERGFGTNAERLPWGRRFWIEPMLDEYILKSGGVPRRPNKGDHFMQLLDIS